MSRKLLEKEVPNSSTFMDDPAKCLNQVAVNENESVGTGQNHHNAIHHQIDERYLQYGCEGDGNRNDGALQEKKSRPQLSVATRRHGRQDLCIGRSGTYEYVQDDLSSKSFPPGMKKGTSHRNRQNQSLFNKFHWLDLDGSTRDSCFAHVSSGRDNLSSSHSPVSGIGRGFREADASEEVNLDKHCVNFGLSYDRCGADYDLQKSIYCTPNPGMVPLRDLDEGFGWIPIGYEGISDDGHENDIDYEYISEPDSTPSSCMGLLVH